MFIQRSDSTQYKAHKQICRKSNNTPQIPTKSTSQLKKPLSQAFIRLCSVYQLLRSPYHPHLQLNFLLSLPDMKFRAITSHRCVLNVDGAYMSEAVGYWVSLVSISEQKLLSENTHWILEWRVSRRVAMGTFFLLLQIVEGYAVICCWVVFVRHAHLGMSV